VVIDGDSRIQEFNRAAEWMFGYSAAEVVGQRLELLMPADFARDHREHVDAANHGDAVRAMGRGREVMGRARDGREFPIEVSVGSASETGIHLHVGIIRDISERRAVELELQRLATTDGLTGLLNRRAFTGEGERLVALARRYGHPLSVMILDADKFKSVNDNHGHPVGDQVLQALARAIEGVLRQTDVFGRLGGEEFGVVLPETDASGATRLGTRLLEAVRACRVPLPQGELGFTVSLGIAVLGPAPDGLESALRRADGALYQAKQGGRDRLQMAGPDAGH
jgi:diguanylate cyclase (GGDEF)-like protein/PAS domain S-box-containing protein